MLFNFSVPFFVTLYCKNFIYLHLSDLAGPHKLYVKWIIIV